MHNRLENLLRAAVVVIITAGVSRAERYAVLELGPAAGGMSEATAISGSGDCAGIMSTPDPHAMHAALWNPQPQILGALPLDAQSLATAFGAPGHVYGVSYDFGDVGVSAFLWSNGQLDPLGQLFVRSANNVDMLAGFTSLQVASVGLVETAAVRQGGAVFPLGTLGGTNSYAHAVNSAGDTVGTSYLSDDVTARAFLFRGGVMRDLGTLGGQTSDAYTINDRGQVAGVSDTAGAAQHAFVFQLDSGGNVTGRVDLGTLAGGYSYAHGINNAGVVVGTSDGRAFRWKGDGLRDLNTLIPADAEWRLDSARGVNENGQIVGSGLYRGQFRGFRLDPRSGADFDVDGDVDMDDFGWLQACYSGAAATPTGCAAADLDGSGKVDARDLTAFITCAKGPAVAADTGCPE